GTFALLAKAKSVTHVSGMNCHPSLGKDIFLSMRRSFVSGRESCSLGRLCLWPDEREKSLCLE
ncbi:hypothetical protein GFM44_35450, partial [Rhizobium leguminosarum bv. viciae]|nr:hypothetical protein [Rhizobium leguminosarum bv. viciae]